MANMQKKRYSASLVIREKQIKTTRSNYIPYKWLKVLDRMSSKWNSCTLLVGMQNETATLEDSLVISLKS